MFYIVFITKPARLGHVYSIGERSFTVNKLSVDNLEPG